MPLMTLPPCDAAGAGLLLAAALWTDWRTGRIPNALTVGGLVIGGVTQTVFGNGGLFFLAGAAAGLGVFFVPFLLGGLGGGDVKLFAALGGWMGWRGVLLAALLTAVAGGGIALLLFVRQGGARNGVSRLALAWRTGDRGLLRSPERFPYTLPAAVGVSIALYAMVWSS